jgi:hypothetical protein
VEGQIRDRPRKRKSPVYVRVDMWHALKILRAICRAEGYCSSRIDKSCCPVLYVLHTAVAWCNIQKYIARSESSTTFNPKPSGEAFGATFHGMA